MPALTIAVCTRNRPRHVTQALVALEAQTDRDFDTIVVDQSDDEDPELARRAAAQDRLCVLRRPGRGLSRARNDAVAAAQTDWVAFVDDDCLLAADWVAELRGVLARHPDVGYVAGHVGLANVPPGEHLGAAARPVAEERVLCGARVWPQHIGFGVCMVLRRDVVQRLGGWDERLGPGVADFPASDDMDFNYRLLRAGEAAAVTPRMRAAHDEWRDHDETVALYEGYARAWAGFALKHAKTGDLRGGAWLWSIGLRSQARMLASALRHRSRLRARVARAQLRGLAAGTLRGGARRW
jgi:GT2 family glycosyltransferase